MNLLPVKEFMRIPSESAVGRGVLFKKTRGHEDLLRVYVIRTLGWQVIPTYGTMIAGSLNVLGDEGML